MLLRHQCADKFKPLDVEAALKHPGVPKVSSKLGKQALATAASGINFYQTLQMDDGHWAGDYGGPMFLMPGMIITMYVTGTPIDLRKRDEMLRYLYNHQAADGGWGLHIESHSTIFGTAMNYVAMRLLGASADDPRMIKARLFILSNGGALGIPQWGKFWLSVLGVFSWDGLNTLFPELWATPEWLPVHPWRWWCHCRMVYLPMAYIYGSRFVGPITPLVKELRRELFCEPWETINWPSIRSYVAPIDVYYPQTALLKVMNVVTNAYEKFVSPLFIGKAWRNRSLSFLLDYIHAEDDQTSSICIGPVNKFINMLAVFVGDGADSKRFKDHIARVDDYLWMAEDGMKCQGYNGSQLWDTAFAVQAIVESGLGPLFLPCLAKTYEYVDCAQVLEDVANREKFYRFVSSLVLPNFLTWLRLFSLLVFFLT